MIIPPGGAGLHEFCRENSLIPVITGGIGICHLFVDDTADQDAALKIIHNAKTQRPSVCNALDTVLVHQDVSKEFLPRVVEHLAPAGVTFRAESKAMALLQHETVHPAGEKDFDWRAPFLLLSTLKSAHSTGRGRSDLAKQDNDGLFPNAG